MSYDSPIFVKLAALAECLCAQIKTDGLPDVCFCGVVPGEAAIPQGIDGCTDKVCGMAWVRLNAIAPITGIGIPNLNVDNCNAELGFDAEVGIWRCGPFGDADGNPPSDDELLAATDLQVADAHTIFRAIACCKTLGDFIIETYTPLGPEGGTLGGFWTLSAGA